MNTFKISKALSIDVNTLSEMRYVDVMSILNSHNKHVEEQKQEQKLSTRNH